jgi:outer membrane protein insertion porin family
VQTGTPSENCEGETGCSPNGHTGASPRILFNVSRTNLRGTDQSITLRTNYGTLEQVAQLIYQDPHVGNKPNFNLTLSGGYNNSAVITTYRPRFFPLRYVSPSASPNPPR